ncbi:MAG: esterase/lipase family protein [Lachnospiraceae bacterium]
MLEIFLFATVLNLVSACFGICGMIPGLRSIWDEPKMWGIHILLLILVENIVFWNGIIRIYLSSYQLGIQMRIVGIICGMIPIVNLVVLFIMIFLVERELEEETIKLRQNALRKEEQICKTRYPILLVHGVFFRDSKYLNYWGRIPGELEKNGARVFYGNNESAVSIAQSAEEIKMQIQKVLQETGCEKVNIIAHSKGGLDCRYMLAKLDMAPQVASLTTINTPHRGCIFADYLLQKISEKQQQRIAKTYNSALKKLGDTNPDFLGAVSELTASSCRVFNEEIKDAPGVYYQSVGSRMKRVTSGKFPLTMTTTLVKHFDGPNDGLVGKDSFPWGEKFTYLQNRGNQGITHADMVDLNRKNIRGFDVREFYVQLVRELAERGL